MHLGVCFEVHLIICVASNSFSVSSVPTKGYTFIFYSVRCIFKSLDSKAVMSIMSKHFCCRNWFLS